MAKTITKSEDTSIRDYVDRLLLENLSDLHEVVKLSELAERLSNQGIGLAAVRSLLSSNPDRFAFYERRWLPAPRLAGKERPLVAVLQEILTAFNGPVAKSVLITEAARTQEKTVKELEETIDRVIQLEGRFVVDGFDRVSLVSWSFVASDELRPRALALNDVTQEEIDHIAGILGEFDPYAPNAVELALSKASPVRTKALGAYFWSAMAPKLFHLPVTYSSAQFLTDALSVAGYEYGPDGILAKAEESKKWIQAAIKLSDKLVPVIEVEDAQPFEIKPEDIKTIIAKIEKSQETVTGSSLLEELFEITPTSRTYKDDLHNLLDAVRSDSRVVWVGGDRLQKQGLIPEGIDHLPELFLYEDYATEDAEGEPVDVELTDEGLSTTLRKLIVHPLATDVQDEVPIPSPKVMPEAQRLVLKSIHRDLGTFPLCQFYQGWLEPAPDIQELVIVNSAGADLKVWVNHRDRIMYNWIEWWLDQPIENGAVFNLVKTNRPNVFEFSWHDQPDPVVYINKPRMEILRDIGANSEGKTCFQLLTEVIQPWTKGVDFLTLVAEMNVVRRVRSRLVASLLSSYECFYQRQNSPVWHFDNKKVELGFNKAKKKFIKK